MSISIPVSWGEFFDKITILTIKKNTIKEPAKLRNITHELKLLTDIRDNSMIMSEELKKQIDRLQEANQELWDIEDRIRLCEKNHNFGDDFITLARSVYITNDRRASIKSNINAILHSDVMEEKSYQHY
jgi:hypothetical protein